MNLHQIEETKRTKIEQEYIVSRVVALLERTIGGQSPCHLWTLSRLSEIVGSLLHLFKGR
jgi:hypothetical protein